MVNANIHEAKTHLSSLLKRVMSGEEVIISNAGRPVAKLVPYTPHPADRVPGCDRGAIAISEDFDAPLPESIMEEFEK
ncbi:MAG: type II toxin-antitoxin system Phd/YefM family antitoxin [Spirochaetia bacterium]|jgi:prevent-host-death family protein